MRAVLVLLISLPVLAQRTPAWPTTPANCTVDGQVVNSVTGQPVAGAVVTLYNKHAHRVQGGAIAYTDTTVRPPEGAPQDNPQSVTADDQGRFSFAGLEPGGYVMAASKASYLRTPYKPFNMASGAIIQLEPDAAAHGLVIRLKAENALSGHIFGAGGAPLAGVRVALSKYIVGMQGRQLAQVAAGATDARGAYRLRGFAPDRYYLQAAPPLSGGAYLPVFYPAARAIGSAQQVEFSEGLELSDMDMSLPQGPAPAIRGAIAAMHGAIPISVEATSKEFGQVEGMLHPAGDGPVTFEIPGLRPGAYCVHARAGKSGIVYEAWMNMDLDSAGLSGIVLRPAPPVDIRGRVELEGVTGAKLSRLKLALDNSYSVGYDRGLNSNGIAIPVQDDGAFALTGVPPAVYRITPIYTLGGYLQAVRMGGADITETGLDLTHGGPPGDLQLLLSPGAGTIQGPVLDENGKGAVGALIALLPVSRPADPQRARESSKLTVPDLQGRYTFSGIPPGSYRLLAWKAGVADGKTVLYDADYLQPFETQARIVQIVPFAHETVPLQAIP
jgi:protocatechuate 3,4-dioxygenase beta subunit